MRKTSEEKRIVMNKPVKTGIELPRRTKKDTFMISNVNDKYVFSSSMLSKSLPYSIPFYQRKSLDEKTFPEK